VNRDSSLIQRLARYNILDETSYASNGVVASNNIYSVYTIQSKCQEYLSYTFENIMKTVHYIQYLLGYMYY